MPATVTAASIIAAIANMSDTEHEALRAALRKRDTVKATQAEAAQPLSALRAGDTPFTCGVAGHGKNDDGKFATIGGFTSHAKWCEKAAEVLAGLAK